MKELIWLGNSRERLRKFPNEARRQAGIELRRVQRGLSPTDWKFIHGVGTGVMEIRIHLPSEYRVVYLANRPEGVYILHAFSKKSQKTLFHELKIVRQMYAEIAKT
jgi:phage-related protein